MNMKGFYARKKAVIKRVDTTEKNEIGEVISNLKEVGKVNIRLTSTSSSYVRTESGFVKENLYEALVPEDTDIVQGDTLVFDKTYLVLGVENDQSGVFSKLTLEIK